MMYMRMNLIIIVFTAFIFNACSDEPVAPYSVPNPVQPLSVGNEWVYTDSVFATEGISVGITRIVVSKATQVSSGQILFDWQVYGGNTLLRTNIITTDQTGLWHHGEFVGGDTLKAVKQWAKYPVKTGDVFTEPRYNYSASGGFNYSETWTWKCVSKSFPIILADGRRIYCIAFQTTDSAGAETTILYAENIGYAGWITRVNGSIVFKETLASYSLNH